jgi:hypothetical protein
MPPGLLSPLPDHAVPALLPSGLNLLMVLLPLFNTKIWFPRSAMPIGLLSPLPDHAVPALLPSGLNLLMVLLP